MVGCVSKSRGCTVPLPHEINRLELYRRPQSAQTALAGRKLGDFNFTDKACLWLFSLSHARCPLENIEGKGKKCN